MPVPERDGSNSVRAVTGTRQRGKSRKGGYLRRVFAVVLAVSVAAVVPALTPSSPASAAIEIDWYVATPGFVRTNLQPTHLAAEPQSGILYAVLEGDTGSWTLLKIDLSDFTVLSQVSESSAGSVNDVEVSAAGAVYVVTDTTVLRYDSADLSLAQRTTLVAGDPRGVVGFVVAQDRPDRFALYDPAVFRHVIYDGTSRVTLDGLGPETIGVVGFGSDSDLVLGVVADGASVGTLATFDISTTPPTLIEHVDDWMFGLGVGGVGLEIEAVGDNFLAILTGGRSVTLTPIVTDGLVLQPSQGFRASGTRSTLDLDGRHLFARGSRQNVMSRFDIDDGSTEPVSWSFPTGATIEPRLALGEGVIVAFERSLERDYLVVANSNIMASPFGQYHPIDPVRLLDTRRAIGVPSARRIGPGETITVEIAGRGGLPDGEVLAVTMNATVTEPTAAGFIKLWPSGESFPEVSNVNYVAGQTVANAATVTVGVDGDLQLFNSGASAAHVLLDITGYYSTAAGPVGSRYETVGAPARVFDTRGSGLGSGRLGPGQFIDVEIPAGRIDGLDEGIAGDWVPTAAVLSVTAVGATEPSFLSVYPSDLPSRPNVSTLNFVPGDIRSNSVVTRLSSDGTVRVFNRAGSVDVIVDFYGYYVELVPSEADAHRTPVFTQEGRLYPTTPFRRFDSRVDSPFPGSGALEPGSALILSNASGWTDIWNVTATQPTEAGYFSVIPYWGQLDLGSTSLGGLTSNVNFVASETAASAAYAFGNPDNAIINPRGFTHLIVDVFGYLTPSSLTPIEEVFSRVAAGGLTAELRRQPAYPPFDTGVGRR